MRKLNIDSLLLCGLILAGLTSCNQAPVNFQKQLQEQLIKAKAGDVIEVPEGKFHLDRTLSLSADKVTIRGKGMDKSILSFAGQKEGGSGLLVKANDFIIEDVAIEDTAGDGLTVQGGNNITIRRVRVEWTRGANTGNGPYAIYPTDCKNVLVEDSVAKGAVDTGFYIGQSEYVVMRRNRAEYNVDGYEVENSKHVDVYDNVAVHNTGGLGIFNLPTLPKQGGQYVRAFRNQIYDNNTPNFAPKSLGSISHLPSGTGMFIMAINNVEVFQNKIHDNNTTNVYVIRYNPELGEIKDARYRPFTEQVYLHDNEISGGGKSPDVSKDDVKALSTAIGGPLPDILYDGVVDPAIRAAKKGANPAQICIANNGAFTFMNADGDHGFKHPLRDLKIYQCSLPALEAVVIPQLPLNTGVQVGGQQ
ncbi:MAG TPA: parallel beta-helix domain-containing protein [Candidatus Angelobacter sp.]|jgi:parallel beta-helix repeat protein|nr:parallel beta-helix domain-containing protein [Candidatus Angelobacter sp.]